MPLIPALGNRVEVGSRWEGTQISEFEASLLYIVSSMPCRVTQCDLVKRTKKVTRIRKASIELVVEPGNAIYVVPALGK